MNETRALLLEIGVEELPAGIQEPLVKGLRDALWESFRNPEHPELGILAGDCRTQVFSTPRRLGIYFSSLLEARPKAEGEHRGPPVSLAFDEQGAPTKAALGFARRFGVDVADLEAGYRGQDQYLFYKERLGGDPSLALLSSSLPVEIQKLSVPKRMRWGDLDWGFARPVHWILALFGEELVPFEVGGIATDRFTRGHRYHAPEPVHLDAADAGEYRGLLHEAFVEADPVARRAQIQKEVRAQAEDRGGQVPEGEQHIRALLDEVTGLVEWPVPFRGGFDERYLALPREVLITSMEKHQRFFPVQDSEGHLLPVFVGVANIESKDPEALRAGHERVLRARLEDARFFWEADRQRSLADRVDALRNVVFQVKLGTLYDKAERLAVLAPVVSETFDPSVAPLAERAGWLAKADLLTEMVGEFDSLQGIMGAYYAREDGEDPQVAAALAEQYRPGHAGGSLPSTSTGTALALAERLDTIVGCFGIGLEPSGTKDPFGLRRAAIGLLRIVIERAIHLDLPDLIQRAYRAYGGRLERSEAEVVAAVHGFLNERLEPMYMEAWDRSSEGAGVYGDLTARVSAKAEEMGLPPETTGLSDPNRIRAILSLRPKDPFDAHLKLAGLLVFLNHPDAHSLINANKRIANILAKAEEELPAAYDPKSLTEPGERALVEAFESVRSRFEEAVAEGNYTAALLVLARLREPVDRFFDEVLVLTQDDQVRRNRLALLKALHDAFLRVADFSRLPG